MKKGARPPATGQEAGSRRPGFGEGGGNRTRGYITYPKKNCLAGFATIERALRQRDYAPGGSLLVSPRNYGSAPRLSRPGISDLKPTTFRCEAGRPAAD